MNKKHRQKVLLTILDGFGESKKNQGNAIKKARMPFYQMLRKKYPTTFLKASGNAVGLPKGFMGNSEVGHFTIGAGRIVWQSLEMINRTIRDKSFFKNEALLKSIENAKKYNSAIHLIGMISDEGVHAQIDHLFALLKLISQHKLKKVYIHAITDGRDVSEKSAKKYIEQIQKNIKKYKTGKIVTIIGRYYAMDRDNNWERTLISYELLVHGKGRGEKDPLKAIENAYQLGDRTDYYLRPITLDPSLTIQNNDSIIFFNYRTDRARQLTYCFTQEHKIPIKTKKLKLQFTCMGPYSKKADIAFNMNEIKNNLGSVIDKEGLRQLRIAETEKYAHVTFFFNSQRIKPYNAEKRILIDSPKVPSYNLKPEMSAPEITKKMLKELQTNQFDLIVLNFANTDLVAHSGSIEATIRCCEIIDDCLKQIIPRALKKNYHCIVTSDHGNAEKMLYDDGTICPAHSCNPVPFTLVSKNYQKNRLKKNGGLKDIAVTILNIMDIQKPKEMKGESLITKKT
ncbi:2,3-bisphosphoglycerate-independent phosphoglycerate mutase [Candidatus Peregrinibacteria bacterium]|nr:2,3-bisphosphoglycerate-independent phosphoglycerate mutase [Candidatus Peregrinibacteria bacterium]